MAEQHTHFRDRIALGWLTKETSYNTMLLTWDATTAQTVTDLTDDAPHETFPDTLTGAELIRLGHALPTEQALARQSVRVPYATPRAVSTVIAGSLGLTLGQLETVQQGVLAHYRHKITPGAPLLQPSISALVAHQDGDQWLYPGLTGESWTLKNNGAFLALECPLLGSGLRQEVITSWPPTVAEPWLLWGDCAFYVQDVLFVPVTLPVDPVQGSTNLGAGTLDLSSRIMGASVTCRNALLTEDYRVSTGLRRASLMPSSRQVTLSVTIEVHTDDEASMLEQYFDQRPMAIEWQCVSGPPIVTTALVSVGPTPLHNALALTAQDATTWHVWPIPSGNLVASAPAAAPPPMAPIYPASTGWTMRGLNGYLTTLSVLTIGGEPQIVHTQEAGPPDTSILEYMELADPTGTPWYFWYVGPPDAPVLARDTSPPVFGSTWAPGFVLIAPRVQWRPPTRAQQGQRDTLTFEGVALEWGGEPALAMWVYNQQPYYLV